MKLLFYRIALKWILRDRDELELTGKQKSQVEVLLKKMEKLR